MSATLQGVLARRSAADLVEPGPTRAELDTLLRAATTVPDHGGLQPWRLVVIEGEGRARFGDALAAAGLEADPALAPHIVERLRAKAFAAPAAIAVAARVGPTGKVPQVASASCCGYAIALAADALGLGAVWKSSAFMRGRALFELLDLEEPDEFLGWVNLGRPAVAAGVGPRPARRPVDLDTIVRRAGGSTRR